MFRKKLKKAIEKKAINIPDNMLKGFVDTLVYRQIPQALVTYTMSKLKFSSNEEINAFKKSVENSFKVNGKELSDVLLKIANDIFSNEMQQSVSRNNSYNTQTANNYQANGNQRGQQSAADRDATLQEALSQNVQTTDQTEQSSSQTNSGGSSANNSGGFQML